MKCAQVNGLYVITPDRVDTSDLLAITKQALEGGAKFVQYRNKIADTTLRRKQAYMLLCLCRDYRVPLIINDHVELAIEVDADGVHVGQKDISVTEARSLLGPEKIIGVSCNNRLELAAKAEARGADYIAFGAFFVSNTKTDTVNASIDLLCQARQKLLLPIVAIGGITLTNATALIGQGSNAVAVSSALFGAQDIQTTAKAFSRLF